MKATTVLSNKFLRFFHQYDLPYSNCPHYLLAVSGGLDSIVMAHLFHKLHIPCAIAHVNFGLRGAESDGDEDFVKTWAANHSIACYTEKLDAQDAANVGGISIQMAARNLRYDFFDRLRQIYHFNHIATAHTKNDNVETALYHFSRGTGLAGMCGIPEYTDRLIRPLLQCKRSEILAYAQEHEIKWSEDSSNAKTDYTRNHIRLHIVPQFEAINPSFLETAARNMQHFKKSNLNYLHLFQMHLDSILDKDNQGRTLLPIKAIHDMPEPFELLWFWLNKSGYEEEQVQQLVEHIDQPGWSCTVGKTTIAVDRSVLILHASHEEKHSEIQIFADDIMVRLGSKKKLFVTNANHIQEQELQTPLDSIYVASKALTFPLVIRAWHEGDIFQPFGMEGKTQKVQDFLVNQKVAVPDKSQIPILVNGDGSIIWIVGFRFDHRFRVRYITDGVTKFTYISE